MGGTLVLDGSSPLQVPAGAGTGKVLTSDSSGFAAWGAAAGGGIAPPAGAIGGTTGTPTVVSTHLTAALPVLQGGTGSQAASANAAFNVLSPLDRKSVV